MGRTRYVWLIGIAGWGLTTGMLWSLLMSFRQGWDQLPLNLVLGVIIFPIGGYFLGQWMWKNVRTTFSKLIGKTEETHAQT